MSQFGSQQVGGQRPLQNHGSPMVATPKPAISTAHTAHEEETSIGLIHDDGAGSTEAKIKTIGVSGSSVRKEKYTRHTALTGTGSCRIRSFHGRLSAQGLEYMDNQINEWLDAHADVEVKFVTSTVGVFEGKMREPALILNLWY